MPTNSLSPDAQAIMGMTADTIGRDLLSALVTEIKLLPKPWQALSEAKQDDIIGTCSICSGPVLMPVNWLGTMPPKPACDWCGARQADGFGPLIKMERPMISRRAAREGRPGLEKESER